MTAVRVTREGAFARVILDRPEIRNAFDAALIAELQQAFDGLGAEPPDALRGVLLAGEGPIFCAGADVEWMRAAIGLSIEENERDATAMQAMLAAIDACPVPSRFDGGELSALAAGRLPGSDAPLFEPTTRTSIRVRLPGSDTRALEADLADAIRNTEVDAAYLVESDGPDGRPRLMLGLVGEPGASATVDVPDETDVVWLEEPLLTQVRAVAEPFHRRGRDR